MMSDRENERWTEAALQVNERFARFWERICQSRSDQLGEDDAEV